MILVYLIIACNNEADAVALVNKVEGDSSKQLLLASLEECCWASCALDIFWQTHPSPVVPGADTGVPKGGGVLDCKYVREIFDHAPKQLETIGYVHTASVDSSIMITQRE